MDIPKPGSYARQLAVRCAEQYAKPGPNYDREARAFAEAIGLPSPLLESPFLPARPRIPAPLPEHAELAAARRAWLRGGGAAR